MENEKKDLNFIIGKNINFYRKQLNLTQLELAEKLNYSDKTISKWERGESIPDVFVLNTLAEYFNISLNDLLVEKTIKPKKKRSHTQLKPLFYVLIAWALFVSSYGVLKMIFKDHAPFSLWHLFIYPIPISGLIFFVFNLVWEKLYMIYISLTVFIWTLALSIQLLFLEIPAHLFYIITSALYIFFMYLIFYLKYYRKKNSKK